MRSWLREGRLIDLHFVKHLSSVVERSPASTKWVAAEWTHVERKTSYCKWSFPAYSGRHGDLLTHLQYSVPVAVLYLCRWTIVEVVNLQFFAMHLLIIFSFCIVHSCVLVYFLIQECHQENVPFYLFFTRSFSQAYEASRKNATLAATSVVTVFLVRNQLHVGAVNVLRCAAGSISPPWIFRFKNKYSSVGSSFIYWLPTRLPFIIVLYVFMGSRSRLFDLYVLFNAFKCFWSIKHIMLESIKTCIIYLYTRRWTMSRFK